MAWSKGEHSASKVVLLCSLLDFALVAICATLSSNAVSTEPMKVKSVGYNKEAAEEEADAEEAEEADDRSGEWLSNPRSWRVRP